MSETYHILSFDPPSTINFGWACFAVTDGEATLADSGVEILPKTDDVCTRLLAVETFVLSLLDRFDHPTAMVFERSIGGGFAATRENLGENTGVIKLIGVHRGMKIEAINTGTMALKMTGSASKAGKKTRLKQLARRAFFPGAKTFISIASYVNDKGETVEFFEHQADAICFGAYHLLTMDITVIGPGGSVEFVAPTQKKKRKRTKGQEPEEAHRDG